MTKPLIWDAHSCLTLHPDTDLGLLERHRALGVTFVSINIGMDMTPFERIMQVIASFRAQIAARPDRYVQVEGIGEVRAARASGKLAIGFDLEGGVGLLERPEMVGLYARLGVKMIHLAYNRNNSLAGGCYDEDVPLSPLGRKVVEAIHRNRLLMDVSHTGRRSSLDIMNAGLGPVVYSHANPKDVSSDPRNIDDEQIAACVATGGVVCANGVGRFLADPRAGSPAVVEAIDRLVQKIGAENVGLGLDYSYPSMGLEEDPPGLDRDHWWPAEWGYGPSGPNVKIARPEQIPEIAHGLERLGYPRADVAKIMGENMARLAARVWDGEKPEQ